jgi:hypothetical protein
MSDTFQVWRSKNNEEYVRVIHDGTPVQGLEWVALMDFIGLLERQVPESIRETCAES